MSEHEQDEEDEEVNRLAYRTILTITALVGLYFLGQTVRAIGIMFGWWG